MRGKDRQARGLQLMQEAGVPQVHIRQQEGEQEGREEAGDVQGLLDLHGQEEGL